MGLFVVFEGVDGSGKSTQTGILHRHLSEKGVPVTSVHEPGGTPTGERIREWIKTGPEITPLAELLLFMAARASLVESVILPALAGGEVVISDRYAYSTVAYQGHGRGLGLDTIDKLNETATQGLLPDIALLLDLSPAHGLARKAGTPPDRFELERLEFHERVRQGYLEMARRDLDRWRVIDASRPVEEIGDLVGSLVEEKLLSVRSTSAMPRP